MAGRDGSPRLPLNSSDPVGNGSLLLFHDYRRAFFGVFEKGFGPLLGQTDAAVGGAKRRHVAGVHSVTATEAHEIRHSGTVEVRAARLRVIAHVEIGSH